jgi:hypothetical protein
MVSVINILALLYLTGGTLYAMSMVDKDIGVACLTAVASTMSFAILVGFGQILTCIRDTAVNSHYIKRNTQGR